MQFRQGDVDGLTCGKSKSFRFFQEECDRAIGNVLFLLKNGPVALCWFQTVFTTPLSQFQAITEIQTKQRDIRRTCKKFQSLHTIE